MNIKKRENRLKLTRCGFKLMRFAGNIVLWTTFLFWGFQAVEKLMVKPTSSNVAFTNGDDDDGNFAMPAVTLCFQQYEYIWEYKVQQVNKCYGSDGSIDVIGAHFHAYLRVCLDSKVYSSSTSSTTEDYGSIFGVFEPTEAPVKTNRFSTMKEYLEAINLNISEIVNTFRFSNETNVSANLPEDTRASLIQEYWVPFFDMYWGQCFTFDPLLNNFTLTSHDLIEIEFKFDLVPEGYVPRTYFMIIHDSFEDRFDAFKRNPRINIEKSVNYELKISKTVVEKLNKDERKCFEEQFYGIEKCTHLKGTQMFIDKFNCTLPWMTNDYEFQNCTSCESNTFSDLELVDLIDQAIEMYKDARTICPNYLPCKRSIYQDLVMQKPLENSVNSKLTLHYSSPYIQMIKDSWSYDMQSFIGEVGGTLGLLLGFSFASLFDLIEYFLSKF